MVVSNSYQTKGTIICGGCGAHISEESTTCQWCGRSTSIQNRTPRENQYQSPKQPTGLPICLQGVIIFRPRETMIRIWQCSKLNTSNSHEGVPGYLLASNHKVYFIKSSGLFNKVYTVSDMVAYENMGGVSFKEAFFEKFILINSQLGGDSMSLKFMELTEADPLTLNRKGSPSLQGIQQLLNQTAQKRLQEIEDEKRKEKIQYVLDFSFLKAEMEKGGLVIQTIKCPSCHANITLPSNGSDMKCQYCGSMVYAKDVFEKMKALIGSV
ncbi:MAG TPA: hypothetical protein VGK23_09490 [Methanomassiliicoccales archaeon]|jgi:DNA-directed RNA polymerase subunit RPC12/RpoP